MSDTDLSDNLAAHPWFFCGIGGSGMLPLATILKGLGATVAGSDRGFDQGHSLKKAAWLESQGFALSSQDGSGIVSGDQILVASAAVEDTVPEMVRAKALGCSRMTRAELLARLFNNAETGMAVGGTSGKSTVTAMLGWIMYKADQDPTIMNGAVMKNFIAPDAPFASARVGNGDVFVSEVDESDGSIALYRPKTAVLLNVSLDHKSMEDLRVLFGNFIAGSSCAVVNFDDEESRFLSERADNVLSFGVDHPQANIGVEPGTIEDDAASISALLVDRREDIGHSLRVNMPGRHNLSNALAAIAAAHSAGVPLHNACMAMASFSGLARRFDIIGKTASDISVIDDFGHNPEKCRATLKTLKSHEGRVIAFFQPHGYGPLRQMGHELARTFAAELGTSDVTIMCDPVYFGGTVDRSEGSERIIRLIEEEGGTAVHIPSRDECAKFIKDIALPGDRIVIMGARDDTLTQFAETLLQDLSE